MKTRSAPGLPILAWAVVVVTIALIGLGWIWYGFSLEIHNRIWRDILDRPGGPMSFRFILQPTMAAIAALHDGIADARTGRPPYFWTILSNPVQRSGRLREGLVSTSRIILLGIGMDALYQYRVFGTLFPGEALLVALLLALLPYFLLRGPIDRISRWWFVRRQHRPVTAGTKD